MRQDGKESRSILVEMGEPCWMEGLLDQVIHVILITFTLHSYVSLPIVSCSSSYQHLHQTHQIGHKSESCYRDKQVFVFTNLPADQATLPTTIHHTPHYDTHPRTNPISFQDKGEDAFSTGKSARGTGFSSSGNRRRGLSILQLIKVQSAIYFSFRRPPDLGMYYIEHNVTGSFSIVRTT